MNTLLSEDAAEALKRIHTLKGLTKLTGMVTTREQGEILLTLADEDALSLANVLKNERERVTR